MKYRVGATGLVWPELKNFRDDAGAMKELKQGVDEFFKAPLEAHTKSQGADSNLEGQAPTAHVQKQSTQADFGYAEIFDEIDLRNSTSKSFDLVGISNGITYEQLEEGEAIKTRGVGSTKASVSLLRFGAGLSILDSYFRFNEFYKLDEALVEARNKYYAKKASLHYGLITGLTGIDEAFDTDIATTIDNACGGIRLVTKDKGYFVGERPGFIALCNPSHTRKVAKAIWPFEKNPNDTTSQGPENNIIRLIAADDVPAGNLWVGLPKNKAKSGNWQDLQTEEQRAAAKAGTDIYFAGMFNAIVGDTAQFKKLAFV